MAQKSEVYKHVILRRDFEDWILVNHPGMSIERWRATKLKGKYRSSETEEQWNQYVESVVFREKIAFSDSRIDNFEDWVRKYFPHLSLKKKVGGKWNGWYEDKDTYDVYVKWKKTRSFI